MILIGLGSNVKGRWGTPHDTISHALERLNEPPCRLVAASSLIITPPFGKTDQPDFVNAAAVIETRLSATALMAHLHDLELAADRRRTIRWGPRTLDLDLLDYNGEVTGGDGIARDGPGSLTLPHPGIAERSFVLEPVSQIAPDWRHPVSGKTAKQMIAELARNDG